MLNIELFREIIRCGDDDEGCADSLERHLANAKDSQSGLFGLDLVYFLVQIYPETCLYDRPKTRARLIQYCIDHMDPLSLKVIKLLYGKIILGDI